MPNCADCQHPNSDHEDGVGICFLDGCNCQDYMTRHAQHLAEANGRMFAGLVDILEAANALYVAAPPFSLHKLRDELTPWVGPISIIQRVAWELVRPDITNASGVFLAGKSEG